MSISREGRHDCEFSFFLRDVSSLNDDDRKFRLSSAQISAINPNTKTAPIFRSKADAELTARIYSRVTVLIDEATDKDGNPWGVAFMAMFHMSNDSGLFRTDAQLREGGFVRAGTDWIRPQGAAPKRSALNLAGGGDDRNLTLPSGAPGRSMERYVPLYEAKMIHQFDHRWATYAGDNSRARESYESRDATDVEKADPSFEPMPRYWVSMQEVTNRLAQRGWARNWLLGWRRNARSHDQRTMIATCIPATAVGDSTFLILPNTQPALAGAVLGCLNSLVHDYVARQKVGGINMSYHFVQQFPVLPPSAYSAADLALIVPRVLELTYTSHSLAPFARDLGYEGPPFAWNEDRRAQLRAELDAWYGRAYGLTRDEMRYILDPGDVMGPDYPSETFRVVKANEMRRFGEYRTARLVLQAWDRLERGDVHQVSPPLTVAAPDGAMLMASIDPKHLPDTAWARPADGLGTDAATIQLAALLRVLSGPTPISRVRLAALYALEPRYLTRRLSGTDRATWRRLVGPSAELLTGVTVVAMAPKINATWGNAVTQLRGMTALVEDISAQTWAPGPKIGEFEINPEEWPYGRASFVLKAMEAIALDEAITELAPEDQVWARAYAA